MSSCCEKNFIRHNAHNFFILFLVFLKLLIVSVAFFAGPPCIVVVTGSSWQLRDLRGCYGMHKKSWQPYTKCRVLSQKWSEFSLLFVTDITPWGVTSLSTSFGVNSEWTGRDSTRWEVNFHSTGVTIITIIVTADKYYIPAVFHCNIFLPLCVFFYCWFIRK